MSKKDELLDFADEPEQEEESNLPKYKILIVDDEPQIYQVTKLALNDFIFDGRRLDLIYANSAKMAKEILSETANIAIALVDVVMEQEHSGLELVEWVRNELKNSQIRLIIRTGQPGSAPESSVIIKYDINDYYSKVELTKQRLTTTIYGALRNWRDLQKLEDSKQELDSLRLAQMQERIKMAKVIGFETILDSIPLASAVTDSKGILKAVNKKFEKLVYSPSIDVGYYDKNFSDYVQDFGINIAPNEWYLFLPQLKDGILPITLNNGIKVNITISQINDTIALFLQES